MDEENLGSAIYLNFPNFLGKTTNALKIGDYDIGSIVLGKDTKLPVGHAATILFDPNGNATMYEYGRYDQSDKRVFGSEKRNTKGGNWRKRTLPKRKPQEDYQNYIRRIRQKIPSEYGTFTAHYFQNFDYNNAVNYINGSANNKNRSEYNLANTCGTQAAFVIRRFNRNGKSSSLANPLTHLKQQYYTLKGIFNPNNGASLSSRLWGAIPGSTNMYNASVESISDETENFK